MIPKTGRNIFQRNRSVCLHAEQITKNVPQLQKTKTNEKKGDESQNLITNKQDIKSKSGIYSSESNNTWIRKENTWKKLSKDQPTNQIKVELFTPRSMIWKITSKLLLITPFISVFHKKKKQRKLFKKIQQP